MNVPNPKMNHLNVHYVEDSIQPIIVDAQPTKFSNSEKNVNSKLINKPIHTQKPNDTPYKENNVQVSTGNDPSPNCSNKTDLNVNYADVLKNMNPSDSPKYHNDTTTNINDLAKQFSLFISDLKSVINPLISLLTTVINKIILKND